MAPPFEETSTRIGAFFIFAMAMQEPMPRVGKKQMQLMTKYLHDGWLQQPDWLKSRPPLPSTRVNAPEGFDSILAKGAPRTCPEVKYGD